MAEEQQTISLNPKEAKIGMSLDTATSQIPQGMLSYALNAIVENFDGNSVLYQNETGNVLCTNFPTGYELIGAHNIYEKHLIVLFLVKDDETTSEIGVVDTNTCLYTKKINAPCIGFTKSHPILKMVYKVTNCSTEVYFYSPKMLWMDLEKLPFKEILEEGHCAPIITDEVDCNKMRVQPDFSIPQLEITSVDSDGELTAGTYQFAIQYANLLGEAYTSYYSVTNPLPIFDPTRLTQDFNFPVGKSINVNITNIDITGFYDYFNLAVIKTINNITSVELMGTYKIVSPTQLITYTGQNKTQIRLTVDDVFQKYPRWDEAGDITSVQDILIWSDLTTTERLNYQEIASQVTLQWQTWRLRNNKPYANELHATYNRGYMRDEIVPFGLVFVLDNGYQTDQFPIPSRIANSNDLDIIFNDDVVDASVPVCDTPQPRFRWQVYNTASNNGLVINPCPSPFPCVEVDDCYEGPWESGDFAYWESTEKYPCIDSIWGALANKPIRHHKFPDNLISPIHDENFIYPMGVQLDMQQLTELIRNSALTDEQKARIQAVKIVRGNTANNKSVIAKGMIFNVGKYSREGGTYYFPNYPYNDLRSDPFLGDSQTGQDDPNPNARRLKAYDNEECHLRYTMHSPDTSFYQPGLGNILKLETAEYGTSTGHFQIVKENARYKFLTRDAYATAVAVAQALGFASSHPSQLNFFSGEAAMAAFQVMIDILYKSIPRINYAYQFNSIGNYDKFINVQNDGNKQRRVDIAAYATPGVISLSDDHPINNWQRESSVYLRTTRPLPFPNINVNVPEDQSRWVLSEENLCGGFSELRDKDISAYYASLKTAFVNQYGQIDSYEVIDTGFQELLSLDAPLENRYRSIFGGDTFINKFAIKKKLPFFIDNRVNADDESDIFYNEIGNAAYPLYWLSTDAQSYGSGGGIFNALDRMFGVKINNFDCRADKFFYQDGKFYLFAYGIPYFWTESRVNVDLRQAYNSKEGDFFPHVDEFIPDEWLQEKFVSIQQDNTYWYNKSFSKQNKENFFSRLPDDFEEIECQHKMPNSCIYSEAQEDVIDYRRNSWLIYKPASNFDFPLNYGKLTSLDGMENKAVLARFEKKSLLYNTLLTINTSNPQAAYLGNDTLFKASPPIDYAETDMGFMGSQHKFLLRTEYGTVSADAERGQIFLLQGNSGKELTNQHVNKFFSQYLPFQIKRAFPTFPIDNHYTSCGLHGVYDAQYNRFILTKIDYKPLNNNIVYTNNKFYLFDEEIQLTNPTYFCNTSFTISYDFDNQNWTSFHTYIPNYYVGNNNTFYSGIQNGLWQHNNTFTLFNNFYDNIEPYIIEYPYSFKPQDEILQNIQDYTRVLEYLDDRTFIQTDDVYFNKAILYTPQQCSGLLLLTKKPQNNLALYGTFPKYNTDSKEILYTKSSSFYQFNTFWSLVDDKRQPLFISSCTSLSIYKELNQANMSYSKRSYKKEPLRGKELKVRLILDNTSAYKFISEFTIAPTMKSYK